MRNLICATTGKRRFFTKHEALLVGPRNPKSPLSVMASRGQRAYECEHCGDWHRLSRAEAITPSGHTR